MVDRKFYRLRSYFLVGSWKLSCSIFLMHACTLRSIFIVVLHDITLLLLFISMLCIRHYPYPYCQIRIKVVVCCKFACL